MADKVIKDLEKKQGILGGLILAEMLREKIEKAKENALLKHLGVAVEKLAKVKSNGIVSKKTDPNAA